VFVNILYYLSVFSALVPLYAGIRRFKALDKAMKLLFALLCFAAVLEVLGIFYLHQKKSSVPLFFIYTLAEGFFLVPMYYLKGETKAFRRSVVFGFSCFMVLTVFKLIYQWSNEVLNTVIALQVLFYSAVVLYRMQSGVGKKETMATSFFWINLSIFLYYGGCLFFLMFENTVRYAPEFLRHFIMVVHMLINITYNLLLCIGLWKVSRK
jgi:hypothetical protein